MRVLFSSTWGYGHVLPMVPLARAFAAAGHTVHWAASGDAGEVVTAAGIDAVPAGLDGPGADAARRRLRAALATVRPQEKAAFAFPTMFGEWATPSMVDSAGEMTCWAKASMSCNGAISLLRARIRIGASAGLTFR